MLLTIFGANGQIGRLLVQQALDAGHTVRACIRDPDRFELRHPLLNTLPGSLTDDNYLKQAVRGADAVASVMGPPLKFWYSGTPLTDGHRRIIGAMQTTGVRRFVIIATPSVTSPDDRRSLATILPRVIAPIIYPKPYREIVAMGREVQKSQLDWTIVRFISPTDAQPTGKVEVSFGEKRINFSISRSDIAAFVLDVLTTSKYLCQMPMIANL